MLVRHVTLALGPACHAQTAESHSNALHMALNIDTVWKMLPRLDPKRCMYTTVCRAHL